MHEDSLEFTLDVVDENHCDAQLLVESVRRGLSVDLLLQQDQ